MADFEDRRKSSEPWDETLDAEQDKKMHSSLEPPGQIKPSCYNLNVCPTHINLYVKTLNSKETALGDEGPLDYNYIMKIIKEVYGTPSTL